MFGSEPLIDISDGPDDGSDPVPDASENLQQQAVPYKEKHFLGAISSFTAITKYNENV